MSDSTSIALVTGGNRGIGLAIATSLKAAGHRVVVTYRSGTPPEGFDSVQMDVTDSESVEAGFAKIEAEIGQPEIIVANAGITKDTLVLRMTDEDFESVINANLTGAFRVSKRATKGLLKLKRGRLIFIGSVGTIFCSRARQSRHHRKCNYPWICRNRYDCRTRREAALRYCSASSTWSFLYCARDCRSCCIYRIPSSELYHRCHHSC